MPSRDRQTREILEVTRENPHLSPKEVAARVGCPRTEVTEVLERYDDVEAVERELEASDITSPARWVVPGVLAALGLGIIAVAGGADARLPILLLAVGLLSIALWTRAWR